MTGNTAEIVELPVGEIGPGPLVRKLRVNLDHVAMLRGVIDLVPPIIVRQTGSGWSLIDGTHRLQAAQDEGCATIKGIVVSLDDAEAIEAAIEANTAHGLPLSLSERKTAAADLVASTKFSDRRIADICGISPSTVSELRPKDRPTVQSGQLDGKTAGQDGKSRPASKAETKAQREAIAKMLTECPDLSLNEVARRIGCAPMTVASVRTEIAERGNPAAPAPHPTSSAAASEAAGRDDDTEGEAAPKRTLGVVSNSSGPTTAGEALDPVPVPGQWAKAKACQTSTAANGFGKFMDARCIRESSDLDLLANTCPAELRTGAARVARDQARYWTSLAESLAKTVTLKEAQ